METFMYLIGPSVVLAFCVGYEVGFRRALYWIVRVFKEKENARH